MLGDIVLMKLDMFQVKRKVKGQWSEAEYVVVHQVADDVPIMRYEMMSRVTTHWSPHMQWVT